MGKKLLLLTIIFVVANLYSSTAFAVAPIGPPTAGLKTGQWSAGFGYAHGEIDFDIDWKSDFVSGIPESKAKGVKSNAYLAKFGYGISDDWEFYGFLGTANNKGKIEDEGGLIDGSIDFDGGHNFSGGFGAKWTFLKDEKLSWGTICQVSWSQGEDSHLFDLSDFGFGTVEIDSDFKSFDVFLAAGPTYEIAENWRIYGGPALYFNKSDIDVEYLDTTIAEGEADETLFGGYIGAEVGLDENSSLYADYMLTGDAWAFGTGITWKF